MFSVQHQHYVQNSAEVLLAARWTHSVTLNFVDFLDMFL